MYSWKKSWWKISFFSGHQRIWDKIPRIQKINVNSLVSWRYCVSSSRSCQKNSNIVYKTRVAVGSLSNSEWLKSGTVSFKVLAKAGLSSLCEEHKTLAVFISFLFVYLWFNKKIHRKGFCQRVLHFRSSL